MNIPRWLHTGRPVRLNRSENITSASQRARAEQLLIHPQRVGRVGEVYFEPATQQWHARVYWQVQGEWYAVNLPVTDFCEA
ncbi:MAG: hypothetical protein INF43_04125 [Alphaproteobacteria bacterium]|nr:hypothetical protein [Alphaproteobacteria bacterium]